MKLEVLECTTVSTHSHCGTHQCRIRYIFHEVVDLLNGTVPNFCVVRWLLFMSTGSPLGCSRCCPLTKRIQQQKAHLNSSVSMRSMRRAGCSRNKHCI